MWIVGSALSAFLVGACIGATALEFGGERVDFSEAFRGKQSRGYKRGMTTDYFRRQTPHASSGCYATTTAPCYSEKTVVRFHRTYDEHGIGHVAGRSGHVVGYGQVVDVVQIAFQQGSTFVEHRPFCRAVEVEILQPVCQRGGV